MYQGVCHTISEVFATGWRKKKEAFCDNLQHDDMKRPIFSFLQQRRNTKVNSSIAIFPSSEFEPIYIRSQQAEIIAKPRTLLMRKVLCRIDVFLKFPLSFITRSLVNIYKQFPLLLWGGGGREGDGLV